MVLTAFSSGARHKRIEWESSTRGATSGPAPAVAFTAFADVWPRAAGNGDRRRPMRHWRGRDLEFLDLSANTHKILNFLVKLEPCIILKFFLNFNDSEPEYCYKLYS